MRQLGFEPRATTKGRKATDNIPMEPLEFKKNYAKKAIYYTYDTVVQVNQSVNDDF